MWWARQIAELSWPNNIGKRVCMIRDAAGDEIAETRNKIVSQCLALENERTEIDSLFWIDDDVLVSRGALVQLYGRHVPIASGCYFLKGEPTLPLLFPGRVQGTAPFVPDHVGPMWGVGMGLTLVKADVYRRMLPNLISDKYGHPEWYKTVRDWKVEGSMLDCGGTEDLYFCDKVKHQFDITPVVDCGKWAFGWHFDKDANKGYPEPQFNQWAAGKPVTWETKDGLVTWE